MVILRPTRKLYSSLPVSAAVSSVSDTALGDWYINRIVVNHCPLLLLLSSESLLPAVLPAKNVKTLPTRLAAIVGGRLKRLGVNQRAIDAEMGAMTPVRIAATIDRSVLGIMVDFAKGISFYLESGNWSEKTLEIVEQRLAETPCRAGQKADRVIFPDRKASELVCSRWLPVAVTAPSERLV